MADDSDPTREFAEEIRVSCPGCSRRFTRDVLMRHVPICKKSSQKRRKIFDSAKQRTLGDALTYQQIKAAQKKAVSRPVRNWRSTHNQLISSLQNARASQTAMVSGGPLPPPPPPTINPDYVQCETCGRRFNESAAARHIPFCKERYKRLPVRPTTVTKKSATATRKEYRPSNTKKDRGDSSNLNNKFKVLSSPSTQGRSPSANDKVSPPSKASPTNQKLSNQNKNNSLTPKQSNHILSRVNRKYSLTDELSTSPGYMPDFTNGHDNMDAINSRTGSGRVLRTGKSPQVYEEAKRDIPFVKTIKRQNSNTRAPPGGFARIPVSRTNATLTNIHRTNGLTSPNDLMNKIDDFTYKPTRIRTNKTQTINVTNNALNGQDYDDMYIMSPSGGDNKVSSVSKFCHDCGSYYAVPTARFCSECGVKRLTIS